MSSLWARMGDVSIHERRSGQILPHLQQTPGQASSESEPDSFSKAPVFTRPITRKKSGGESKETPANPDPPIQAPRIPPKSSDSGSSEKALPPSPPPRRRPKRNPPQKGQGQSQVLTLLIPYVPERPGPARPRL